MGPEIPYLAHSPQVDRMTHSCEKNYLPATSLAGGKHLLGQKCTTSRAWVLTSMTLLSIRLEMGECVGAHLYDIVVYQAGDGGVCGPFRPKITDSS